ncbi:hypothetical protein STHU_37190 [Allostella humosa]|nr:DUF6134 family protein [Stella humosa]BBK33085.1 hypothetical protein STHU_37190 [Stella humosa]
MDASRTVPRLARALVAILVVATGPALASDLRFTVFRDGTPIGTHRIQVEQVGDETRVAVDIALEVKIAFVTVYRYSHRNREVWRDGRLVSIDTATDDDGTREFVQGKAGPAGLAVRSTAGSYTAPADVLPTSYWRRPTVDRRQLLDTQKGRLLGVRVERADPPGDRAARYRVRGELDLDLWYDGDDRLRRIAFDFKGSQFDYAPVGQPAPAPRTAAIR